MLFGEELLEDLVAGLECLAELLLSQLLELRGLLLRDRLS